MDLITHPGLFLSIRPKGPIPSLSTPDVKNSNVLINLFLTTRNNGLKLDRQPARLSVLPSSLPTGFWQRQDRPQQQFQSLWQIHSSELPREWHCERVRTQTSNSFTHKNTQNLTLPFFLERMWRNISWKSPGWSIRSTMRGEKSRYFF